MQKEFISVFQITKMFVFKVNYYTLSSNENPHFTTSGGHFIRSKRDYDSCGQCQDMLPKGSLARRFFSKWDSKHLTQLTDSELEDLKKDVEELKNKYNHIIIEKDSFRNLNSNIPFYDIVELSKMDIKK